jgi:hypothetical protein
MDMRVISPKRWKMERMSGLWVFGGRLATVMVVVEEAEESVSVASSCERGGSKMGVTGSRVGGNVGGIRRGRSARGRVRAGEWVVVWVGELLLA